MSQGIRSSLKTCWTYALDIAVKVPLLGIQRPLAARSETRGYSHLANGISKGSNRNPRTPRRSLQILVLLRASSPGAFYLTVLANLVTAFVPSVLIYLGAQLIERVSQGQTLAGVLLILIAYVLLSGFEEAMHALSSCMLDTLKDRLRMKIKRDVNHFVSNYPDM